MSHATAGPTKDLAYDYLNWWLDGWPGAFMAREGFYTFGDSGVKRHLSPQEWAYWYEGHAASCDLLDSQGRTVAKKGSHRPGGSYADRMGNIAVWACIMDEHNYFVRKWEDFLNLK